VDSVHSRSDYSEICVCEVGRMLQQFCAAQACSDAVIMVGDCGAGVG
jgi:hypothetical protein